MRAATIAVATGALAIGLVACDPGDVVDDADVDADDVGVNDEADDVVAGAFSGVAMVHTTEYQGADVEEETEPWDGSLESGGPYSYASIACNEDAPVNNISTDLTTFNTRIPDSRVPASTRNHPMEFDVEGDGEDATLSGTITLTVCQLGPGVTPDPDPIPDPDKDRIEMAFEADVRDVTDEEISWEGSLEIVGGTGLYENLTGEGRIAGYFLCFAPEGCTELGEFADGQYSFMGEYEVPEADIPEVAPEAVPDEDDMDNDEDADEEDDDDE